MKSLFTLIILGIIITTTSCSTTKLVTTDGHWNNDESNKKGSTFIHLAHKTYQVDSIYAIKNGLYTITTKQVDSITLQLYDSIRGDKKFDFQNIEERNSAFQTHVFIESIESHKKTNNIQFNESSILRTEKYSPKRADSEKLKSSAKMALETSAAISGTLGGIGLVWLYFRSLVHKSID